MEQGTKVCFDVGTREKDQTVTTDYPGNNLGARKGGVRGTRSGEGDFSRIHLSFKENIDENVNLLAKSIAYSLQSLLLVETSTIKENVGC